MNFLDLMIIILLLTALLWGSRAGLMRLLLSYTGFVAGLLLGVQVAGWIVPSASNPIVKLFIVLIEELGLASLFAALGEAAGQRLNSSAARVHLRGLDKALGAGLAVIFSLVVVWLGASALTNVRSYDIGSQVKQSLIVRKLDAVFPTPPDIFARLEKIISPNGFPNVFLGLEPKHTTVSPSNSVNNQAVINDEASVVKIQGEGCGGMVFGSGFVVDNEIVVTNAHVVGGIAAPEVVDGSGTYQATPIWFDPDLDVAVLRVNDLADPPLKLTSQILPDNDAAAVLGYPGGGPLVAGNGVIIDHVTAEGRNIYNRGLVIRNIYEVQADVEPGNSGGPLIAADGSVAGIIFAKSLSQNNVGYALMIDEAKPLIRQAIQNNTPVSTASCTAE
ncbi:MAG: MarP family serine protease [Thermoleophilia bacterium]|jgi:S1-C subfamily serine protease